MTWQIWAALWAAGAMLVLSFVRGAHVDDPFGDA
jgi:hypothetical protein